MPTLRFHPIDRAPGGLAVAAPVALAAFLVLAFAPALFACGDTSWHLAAGDWILAHRAAPHADPFSFTFAGRRWVAHEWGAEVAMASVFALGGWSAVALLFAAAVAGTLLIVGAGLARHLPPLAAVTALALVAATLAGSALARPHVLGWLLLAGWLALLLRAREAERAPPLAAAALMLVWANVHASFLLGLGLAAALAGEALVARARFAVLRGWAGFGLLSAAAAVVTPHGPAGLLFPLQLSAMETLPLISEWLPTNFARHPAFALLLAAGGGLIALRGVRVPPTRAVLVLILLAMALAHSRHQAVFAIAAPMLLAEAIGRALPRDGGARRRLPLALMLGCALAAVALRVARPAAEAEGSTNPVAMLDSLPAELLRRPVLNGYAFGGPLIRRGVLVFIDGRADMYGDAFMRAYHRIEAGNMAAFDRAVRRHGIVWTILPPDSALAHALGTAPGWRVYRRDRWAVVHVRTAAVPG